MTSSPAAVSLSNMVDRALGTPELGAVNFSVLHSLLHAMLQRLHLADVLADLPADVTEPCGQTTAARSAAAQDG